MELLGVIDVKEDIVGHDLELVLGATEGALLDGVEGDPLLGEAAEVVNLLGGHTLRLRGS